MEPGRGQDTEADRKSEPELEPETSGVAEIMVLADFLARPTDGRTRHAMLGAAIGGLTVAALARSWASAGWAPRSLPLVRPCGAAAPDGRCAGEFGRAAVLASIARLHCQGELGPGSAAPGRRTGHPTQDSSEEEIAGVVARLVACGAAGGAALVAATSGTAEDGLRLPQEQELELRSLAQSWAGEVDQLALELCRLLERPPASCGVDRALAGKLDGFAARSELQVSSDHGGEGPSSHVLTRAAAPPDDAGDPDASGCDGHCLDDEAASPATVVGSPDEARRPRGQDPLGSVAWGGYREVD